MKVGAALGARSGVSRSRRVELARRVDEAGFEAVFMGESVSSNAFMDLTQVALETSDVTLGVSIANVFTRTPSLVAMSTAALDRLSGGRALLGLGASTEALVEGVHGVPYESPLARLEEYVAVIRRALSGGPIEYDGQFVSPAGGRLRVVPDGDVPIGIAALGPATVRLTGRIADAWIPHLVPRSLVPDYADAIAAAAAEAGRTADDVTVYAYVPTNVDPDPRTARRAVRQHVAAYVGPAPPYQRVVARAGYEDEVAAIRRAWSGGDREGAARAVTDELVDELGLAATPDGVGRALDRWADVGAVDVLMLNSPRTATPETIEGYLAAIEPHLG